MNILYKIGLSIIFMSAASAAVGAGLQDRETLGTYGMHFTKQSVPFNGSDVYLQVVDKSEGTSTNTTIKHGQYKSDSFVMYSQDPIFAKVGDVTFDEYISKSRDVVDTGPMYTLDSEMVLCWIGNEDTLVEAERNKIKKYLASVNRSLENACVSNSLASEYWQGRERHVEIR